MTSLSNEGLPPVFLEKINSENESLIIVYDLYKSLPELSTEIDAYGEVIDIYLLESILYLGKYHKNYFQSEQDIPTYGLRRYFNALLSKSQNNEVDILDIPPDFYHRIIEHAKSLKKRAIQTGVWKHYRSLELPFAIGLFHLTQKGIFIDPAKLQIIKNKTRTARHKLYRALEANNMNGHEIKDLNDWIRGFKFHEYFPASSDEISMKDLALLEDKHQVFKIFLRLDKLKRIERILRNFNNVTMVKPDYRIMGSATGRCTSRNPNVMGIPKIFRPIVIPSQDDFGIVECDYSQMEVGILAALAEDENLIKDYNNGDVYKKVGKWLSGRGRGISRSKAKIIFLGLQYGLSKSTIAKRLEISKKETLELLKQLYEKYTRLSSYLEEQEILGFQRGYAQSISGLRRYRLNKDNQPSYWENNWFKNFPVQSSASSIFKRAIVKMYQRLKDAPFHILVPLYDSVVFEAPLTRLEEITGIVKDCMISSMKDFFPTLKARVSVNDSDPSCWNAEGETGSIENFLENPLQDIDIKEKRSGNVDWSEYC